MLPCFAGDRDPRLERAGEEIAELREDQWIVMHNDDRRRPEVRTLIDRIVGLIVSHRPRRKTPARDRPVKPMI